MALARSLAAASFETLVSCLPPVHTLGFANCERILLIVCREVGLLECHALLTAHSRRRPYSHQEIRKFAIKAMGTKDVRVDVKLNKHIWSRGTGVLRRVRVRIARKRNDDEDAKEELYSLVTVTEIPPEGLKGLGTKIIEDED
ncbi:60S ribosomal protein L31 [Datura stramonium]|uniref:60S ribosomal protein L31 n=1 Tax=Datura stramonium TaxID=4076 RepID=A0ABS8RYI8_DATST|nr:60S ribosomal protein L31 [Datura stramonium]